MRRIRTPAQARFMLGTAGRAMVCLGGLMLAAAGPVPWIEPPHRMATPADLVLGTAADDTDFLFRLGLMEGHLMVGHELLQAKRPELALPHFGHPVRELYDDISDYINGHHFPAFERQLAGLEVAVATTPNSPDTEVKYQAMIVTVHKARELTPADLRASVPANIKLCADTIDAASGEFNESLERGSISSLVEYHDSRGYLEYAGQNLQGVMANAADQQSQSVLKRLRDLLVKAEWIVDPLIPEAAPRASVGQFRAIAGQALALAKSQPTPGK